MESLRNRVRKIEAKEIQFGVRGQGLGLHVKVWMEGEAQGLEVVQLFFFFLSFLCEGVRKTMLEKRRKKI